MNQIIISDKVGYIAIVKMKLYQKIACLILEKAYCTWLNGIKCCKLSVFPDRQNKAVVIQEEIPCDLFQKVRGRHDLIWLIKHILNAAVLRDTVYAANDSDVCWIELRDFPHDT